MSLTGGKPGSSCEAALLTCFALLSPEFDIPGDTTGVLQSGLPFMTLHHYTTGSWVSRYQTWARMWLADRNPHDKIHIFGYGSTHDEMAQIRIISRIVAFLGGDNLFKRYVFGDGHWLMANGYSLTFYEKPLTAEMLTKVVSHQGRHLDPLSVCGI